MAHSRRTHEGRRGHRVPLSDAALAVLEQARALDDGSGLVFPSPLRAGHPLSDMSLTKLLRDRGLADRATVDGFRSAFRDWCADAGPRERLLRLHWRTLSPVSKALTSAAIYWSVGARSWMHGPRSWNLRRNEITQRSLGHGRKTLSMQ